MFYVGQKVVCINVDYPKHMRGRWNGLQLGHVYTIVRTGLTHVGDVEQLPCVEVAELPSIALLQHRFRPVVDRKTDISIFTAMLNPADKRVEA